MLSRRLSAPSTSSLLTATFGLSLLVNLAAVLYQLHVLYPLRSYTYLGHDHPRELPLGPVRTVNMAFHDDPEHFPLSGVQAWAEWNAIRPPAGGYVFIGQAHLPWSVSMWHQLHCLNHVRSIIAVGDDGSEHTEHCFHYIRQHILCAADTTLEPREEEAGSKGVIPGEGVAHTCRDWTQVDSWTEIRHRTWTPDMEARLMESSVMNKTGE
ncbi:hypothetical protein HETIRDRAFT_144814 [Heterobasidion irregulare TC 32-1]|uniref:Uncharacterized protein n=1 Tax=Heterobasidion irregulare (strain TC 32-1) TaxID=747525 RepID=W4JM74_HETIT|nr:uncharacterized protein HETIRDRAFT_144814 [Heterobasidion irregulare TC 32-1]ETW74628.1 hypothetical protein HETIRDRAFT_144814 [Heterobasidion irregulare TC 32-1]